MKHFIRFIVYRRQKALNNFPTDYIVWNIAKIITILYSEQILIYVLVIFHRVL